MSAFIYDYPRPMLTVDAVIFAGEGNECNVALIRRKHDPFAGFWALPGGFVDMSETLEAAATRELHEETGLKNIPLQQFYAFGDLERDPRGRSISIGYWGHLPSCPPLRAADDAAEAAWFPIDRLPQLAFDHDKIILRALRQLKAEKTCAK